jgi:hypothetical protein
MSTDGVWHRRPTIALDVISGARAETVALLDSRYLRSVRPDKGPVFSHFSCLFQGMEEAPLPSGSSTKAMFLWLAQETKLKATISPKAIVIPLL